MQNREKLLQEMKQSVGTKDPIVFFEKMIDVFTLLFDRLDKLENDIDRVKVTSSLSVQWEPKLASNMIANQIDVLRKDKDTYFNELSLLKQAYVENRVTQNYRDFCQFWLNTLGFHPFLDYDK